MGRSSQNSVKRFYEDFEYQAASWDKPRRVIAKIEWHPGELFPRVGFIVTKLPMNRECPELCVSGPVHAVSDTQASKRSPNIMANWLRAANHSLTFLPSFSKFRMAR